MHTAILGLLAVHITAGFLGLLSGAVALLTRKGGPIHRRFGRIYFWAMSIVAVTAFVLAPVFHNVFLFLVAILSFYNALIGYRVLRRKNPFTTPATSLDWIAAITVGASGIAMLVLGALRPPFVNPSFAPMLFVFGGISVTLAISDVRAYIKPPRLKGAWLFAHIGNMIGSYIAALTAFSATNLLFLPTVARWFWPTAVLVPVISYLTFVYGKKMTTTWAQTTATL